MSAFLCLCLLCWVIQSVHSPALAPYGLHELHLPCRQRGLGCLGSNGLLKGVFQHQVNRNYRPKAWLGPAGQEETPSLRMGRRGMTPQIRLSSGDVCGMFSPEMIHSSCDAYWYKENSL